jgi:hypothetical protein
VRERTPQPSADAGPESGPGGRDAASTGWPARVAAGLAVTLTVALLVTAFIPRTVATGGDGDRSWQVSVTPGIISPSIRLTAGAGIDRAASGFGMRPSLDATQVFVVPGEFGGAPTTLVVGPTPAGTDSIRVTSDTHGVGEAQVQRVAWRRVHVEVIEADATIEELVAISDDGRVLEAVTDLSAPSDGSD